MNPPSDVKPEVLFRWLSKQPRIRRPLTYRIKGAEQIELSVESMSSSELAFLLDDAKDKPSAIVCASLLADGTRAFNSPEEIFRLHKEEVAMLYGEVADILSRISPMYTSSDTAAWKRVLKKGAMHPSNMGIVLAMSECVDIVVGAQTTIQVGRPDRYYGIPQMKMSDGQRMAFAAAKELLDEHREQSKE